MAARCPICSKELADVNAVRQHTRAEHSIGSAQDTTEGWVSVAGPGPAGWYPDPWNSKSQRYWDGSQWSGRTAPLDLPPEPAAPEPAMAAAPSMGASASGIGTWAPASDGVDRTPPEHGVEADPIPPLASDPYAPADASARTSANTNAPTSADPGAPTTVDPGAPASVDPDAPASADPSAPVGRTSPLLPPPPVGPLGQPPASPPLGPRPAGLPVGVGAPKPDAPSRPARSATSLARRLPAPVWGALAAAVVLVVIVIVVSGVSSSSPNPGAVPPASPTTAAPAGPVGLAAGVLTAADVGTGWTAYPAGHPLTAAAAAVGPCNSPLWSRDVGGYESSFINGTNADAAHGAVVSQVFEANSVATAVAQEQFIASTSFLPCLEQKVKAEVESQFPKGAGWAVTGDVANPFELQLGNASAVGWVLMVSVRDGFGATSVLTDDSVEIFTGPYEATLDVSWNSKAPLTQGIVQAQATTEAQHLAALPVGGVLTPNG